MKKAFKELLRTVRRIAVIVAGSVVLLAGLAMTILPGPAIIVIPLGVSILATEVPIARRIMRKAKVWLTRQRRRHGPKFHRIVHRFKSAFARPPRPRRRPHSYTPPGPTRPRPSGNP